jgi:tRNA(adenine34) deaminase
VISDENDRILLLSFFVRKSRGLPLAVFVCSGIRRAADENFEAALCRFFVNDWSEHMNENAEKYMREAIKQAKLAARKGEVPVGAVIVRDGEIIARAYNTRETGKNALCHAEIKAIHRACRKLGGWRLPGCELYVTLEPCPMCAGAIVNARIVSVYYGAYDKKAGAFGTLFDMNDFGLNHKPEIHPGILEEDCAGLLSSFFADLRKKQKLRAISKNQEKN